MNTSINDLDSVIQKLEANYNECKISESEGILNINLPIGKIQVKQNRIFFFALNQPFGELEFENSEELYQEIEAFILTLQNEEDKCNPTFNKAEENAQKRCKHATLISGAIFPIAFVAYYLFDLSWIFLTAAMLIPAADLIYLRFIRLYSFRKDWICPYCNAKLPIKNPKNGFPL